LAYENDEFAFFNQQLAAMLRDGIPLEGALRRLCQEMRRGAARPSCRRSKPTSPKARRWPTR
jgi:type II secretory pathway component PulF